MPEAILLFRATCRRCRLLARIATAVALGAMRRVPLDAEAAQELYHRLPQTRGKLALIEGNRVWLGVRVVPAGLKVILRSLARVFKTRLAPRTSRPSAV